MAEKKCNHCGTDKNPDNVPYIAHESAMARSERNSKRLWIIILVLIVALIGTNLAWIIYENSFEDYVIAEEYDVEQDADGGGDNNSIINGGDIVNDEAEN